MTEYLDFRSFADQLNGSLGLVIGPSISVSPSIIGLIRDRFPSEANMPESDIENYVVIPQLEAHQNENDREPELLREEFRDFLLSCEPSSSAEHLAKGNWCAVISLTPDCVLDERLRINLERLPTTRELMIVDEPGRLPVKRSVPVYRLFGTPRSVSAQSRVAITRTEQDVRAYQWAGMMQTLPDHIRYRPILVLGMNGFASLLSRFFKAIAALGPAHPRNFLLLEGDGVLDGLNIQDLERYGMKFSVLSGEPQLVIRYLSEQSGLPRQGKLSLAVDDRSLVRDLCDVAEEFSRVLFFAPKCSTSSADLVRRRVQLTDALFRPSTLDLEPYFYQLNLPRTLAKEICDLVTSGREGGARRVTTILIRGEAGTGKSSLLKEICATLTEGGVYCFWLSPWDRHLSQTDLSRIVERINDVAEKHADFGRAAFFLDDALDNSSQLNDVVHEIQKVGISATLLLSVRSSDLIADTGIISPFMQPADEEYVMPVELDEDELQVLPKFLVGVGIAQDEHGAVKQVASLNTRNADDILCVLWYLVPSTRRILSDSLEDQYLSLGDVHGVIESMAGEAARISAAAKSAWEICAVASSLHLGVPAEVLVRAMGISWDEWIEMCIEGAPLWGLVYPEEGEGDDAILYWTRNDVVTNVLIRLINGGYGHAGEVPILAKMIRACSIGSEAYREFLFNVFVKRRKMLGERYSLEQGRELFDTLFETLPYEDKTFQHQYGLWLKDKDADLSEALKELQKALKAEDYPGAAVAERDEYIRTSIAATVVQQAKRSERTLQSALDEVQENLRYARTTSYLDAHASHVFGSLLLELAQMHADEGDKKSQLAAVADGLAIIERTFQLGGSSSGWASFRSEDQGMLARLQERLVATFDDEDVLEGVALDLLQEHGSQAGFVVLGRKRLVEATKVGKGSAFNEVRKFLEDCATRVEAIGLGLSSRFRALRVDLYVRWQIQREGCAVDWGQIVEDLQELLKDPLFFNDAVKLFYLAVGLFHIGRHEEANALFSQLRSSHMLRRIKGAGRCFYQGKEGFPKQVPGKSMHSHDRWYFESTELNQNIPLRDVNNDDCVNSAHINCYIGFSFLGPFATRKRPSKADMELPT